MIMDHSTRQIIYDTLQIVIFVECVIWLVMNHG